jgi:hypothetical protein
VHSGAFSRNQISGAKLGERLTSPELPLSAVDEDPPGTRVLEMFEGAGKLIAENARRARSLFGRYFRTWSRNSGCFLNHKSAWASFQLYGCLLSFEGIGVTRSPKLINLYKRAGCWSLARRNPRRLASSRTLLLVGGVRLLRCIIRLPCRFRPSALGSLPSGSRLASDASMTSAITLS